MNYEHLCSLNMEQSLIGALLEDPSLTETLENIKTDDFSTERHRFMFECLSNPSIDHIDSTIAEETIKGTTKSKELNLDSYLDALRSLRCSKKNIQIYADEIVKLSKKRKMLKELKELVAILSSNHEETLDELKDLAGKISICQETKKSESLQSLKQYSGDMIDYLNEDPKDIKKIYTGYKGLDWFLKGFHPGQLIVLAALTGRGKTTMAINMAINMAKTNHVAFFSIEITKDQIFRKSLSNLSRVPLDKIEDRTLSEYQKNMVVQGLTCETSSNLFVVSRFDMNAAKIRSCIIAHIREYGAPPIVFVDYLQLIKAQDDKEQRYLQITKITMDLKALAMEFNTTVVTLCQLNRDSEKRADKTPVLSDLRESASIEHTADIVMMIHRLDDGSGLTKVIIAKNRNGERGESTMRLEGDVSTFSEV